MLLVRKMDCIYDEEISCDEVMASVPALEPDVEHTPKSVSTRFSLRCCFSFFWKCFHF